MNNLIYLELKRNNLRSFHISVGITTVMMLGLLYLFTAMPKIEGTETDMELFLSYRSLFGLSSVISMGVFSIMSAIMTSKIIVEDYSNKKAILLFSYPIERKKILDAKILMVFTYTVISMFLCGVFILTVYFITESLFPLGSDIISFKFILNGILSLFCYALIAGFLGIISLWFGFRKKSIIVTIVAACIIASIICQIIAMTLFSSPLLIVNFIVIFIMAMLGRDSLHRQVENMEI